MKRVTREDNPKTPCHEDLKQVNKEKLSQVQVLKRKNKVSAAIMLKMERRGE